MQWLVLPLAFACACTTLGPMPATTNISAVPSGPGVEATVGAVPGFYLSRSAQNKADGAPLLELGALFDPDRWLGVPGLILGARLLGQKQDTPGEPEIGYRRAFSDDFAIAGVVFGSSKRATDKLASYHGARYGAEVAIDSKLFDPTSWMAVHLQVAGNATRIVGSGTYCVDMNGIAIDCNTMDTTKNTMIDGRVSGVYPAGTMTIALDVLRRTSGLFHGARIAALITYGEMPLAKGGVQQSAGQYISGGLTLTLGAGGTRDAKGD